MPSFISFIPTQTDYVDRFFQIAPVSSSDIVYDLGSGDGRLLFAALDKGAGRAVGVELDSKRVLEANETVKKKGLEDRITFLEQDVLDADLANATLVLCYLSAKASAELKPKLEAELKPGTRVVMETFPVPGWKPVETTDEEYRHFYLYIMPPETTE